jgi:peptide/nickel transport system substrate-binding protein
MRNKIFIVASLLIVASMLLAACASETVVETVVVTEVVEVAGTPQVQEVVKEVVVTATPEPEVAATFNSADPTTYTTVSFGDPDTLDTAFDYETAGTGIMQNVYDTLIYYNKDNPNDFVPNLALEVPSLENGLISEDGKIVTFNIRPGVMFHDGSALTASDVAFTFQRGLLQGGYDSPQWLMAEPILGVGVSDVGELINPEVAGDRAGISAEDPAKLLEVCQKVVDAIVADDAAGTVTFNLAQPWAPFISTLAAHGWGAIQSKAWVTANGGWDGDCATWQNFYSPSSEELNEKGIGNSAMGTGPFKLERWTPGEEIVLVANEDYWRTEPAWEGGPVGAPALKTVIIKNVTEFSTRYAMLQAGDADSIAVGSSADWPQMDELTGLICEKEDTACTPSETPDQPLELIRGFEVGSRTDIFMNWNINTEGGNNFVGSGVLDGNGVPADFFSNANIRKAFAYCFNYDAYLSDVLLGEGTRSPNVMLPGQIGSQEDSAFYTYDPAKCAEAFAAADADLKSPDGKPLSEVGFRLVMGFNTGNTARQTICQIMQAEVSAINENFVIECTGLPWPTYLREFRAGKLPISTSGWVEDIDETHNWVQPYAVGTFANRQNMPQELKDQFSELINAAVVEPDPAKRAEVYYQFNQLYYDEVPTLLLYIVNGRRYQQRWVDGWFTNRVFPGTYFYSMSKQ